MDQAPPVSVETAAADVALKAAMRVDYCEKTLDDCETAGLIGCLWLLGLIFTAGFEVRAIVIGPAPA